MAAGNAYRAIGEARGGQAAKRAQAAGEATMRTTINARERVNLLRTIPMFQGCNDRQLAHLAAHLTEIDLMPGDTLMRENEAATASFVITNGEARVTVEGVEINQLRAGDMCGEMALLENRSRCATVTATTSLHALAIPGADFDEMVREPWMARRLLRTIVERLRAAEGGAAY